MAEYPRMIKIGSIAGKVYRVKCKTAASGYAYTAAWPTANGRKLQQFTDEEKAAKHVRTELQALSTGTQAQMQGLTPADVEELRQARQKAQALGIPLLAALDELAALKKKQGRLPNTTVAEIMDWFWARKVSLGRKVKRSYGKIWSDLKAKFGAHRIAEVTTQELHEYWVHRYPHPTTWNTNRKRFVTVFREARKAGYLPKGEQTAIELLERQPEPLPKRGIITPEEARKCVAIIREKQPRYLPTLALAMYCGMRRDEVQRQHWEDIRLEQGVLNVTAAKAGTPSERLVTIPRVALALLKGGPAKGRVSPNVTQDRIRDIVQYAGLHLPENCFRHSYITYLIAKTQNIPAVAIQAGTSPEEIHKHYKRPMPQADGYAYFEEPMPKPTKKPPR